MNPLLGLIYLLFYLVYTYLEALVRIFVPVQKKSFAGKLVLVTGAGHGIGRELALQFSHLGARLVLWDINKALVRIFVPVQKKSFAGKLVLVTGVGHGIGRELALQFSHLGARLVLWDINKDNNEQVANEIRRNGSSASTYVCDVSKHATIKAVATKIQQDLGNIDVLVNNAGILNGGALLKMAESDIKRTIDINIMAYIWTCREFLPVMINNGEGHIINIASMGGKIGTAYLTDYIASKFAVTGFTEALADEMRREGNLGIKFTTVFPNFVATGMTRHAKLIVFDRMLTPTEVASAVIDGAQRNQPTVFIPSGLEMQWRILGLFPRRFVDKAREILDVGIDPQYGEKCD